MEKDPRLYVDHMLEAIANIEMDTLDYDFEKAAQGRTCPHSRGDCSPERS